MICNYNRLVNGWILGSINENVLKAIKRLNSAVDTWEKLEFCFESLIRDIEGTTPLTTKTFISNSRNEVTRQVICFN
ncbi:hypothetical protein HanIR_Chr01g0043421 [Helianthus annuus]|nr:hypothetical protein HanIR_Chr01g0043421 [Helianthus annuus]